MKSTSSSSSGSSRDERMKSLPKLLVSDADGVNVLPDNKSEVISRKNSKTSLKSTNSAAADVNNTKDEIIACMIKDRMKELEDGAASCQPETPSTCHSISMTDQKPLLNTNLPEPQATIKCTPRRGSVDDEAQSGSASDRTTTSRKYSRSHQRRFHRRFPAVHPDERLIDWFNCALIADILLQGYLYISDNYFAFYSNIFGYKTQFLIPISNVVSVTKEKTAKIFPNAVGICTDEAKYVFGSLISREQAYRLLQDVWRSTLYQVATDSCFDRMKKIRDSESAGTCKSCDTDCEPHDGIVKRLSISDDDDDSDSRSEDMSVRTLEEAASRSILEEVHTNQRLNVAGVLSVLSSRLGVIKQPKNNLFVAATVALVLLFCSAAFILIRANFLYTRLTELSADMQLFPAAPGSESVDVGTDANGEDGMWPKTKAAILSWNRVRSFTGKLQVKLREVVDLRHELEQLLLVLKAGDTYA